MEKLISLIFKDLRKVSWQIYNEKDLQDEIYLRLLELIIESKHVNIGIEKEYKLSKGNVVDFFVKDVGLAIELKIKGSSSSIYRQLKRYCKHEEVKGILLLTSRFMGLYDTINGKPAYLYHFRSHL